ncbi:c-type cytochrome, partial [Methylobacterium platani]
APLKASGITWDEASLHEWLKSPKAKVPGTKMMFALNGDDKKIDDVIAYLASKK